MIYGPNLVLIYLFTEPSPYLCAGLMDVHSREITITLRLRHAAQISGPELGVGKLTIQKWTLP
jgi:hypothetical protein